MVEIKKGKWYLVQFRFGCSKVSEIGQCSAGTSKAGYFFNSYDPLANRFLIFDYLVTDPNDVLKEVDRPIAFKDFPENEIIVM